MPIFYSMHTHTHTYTHTCTHAHTHAHTHACTRAHTHACMHTCTHSRMHTHMQAWLYNILPWVTMATGSTVGGYAANWMISHSEWMGGLAESASLEAGSQKSESSRARFQLLGVLYPELLRF